MVHMALSVSVLLIAIPAFAGEHAGVTMPDHAKLKTGLLGRHLGA